MFKGFKTRYRVVTDDQIIDAAIDILKTRVQKAPSITAADDVQKLLRLEIGALEHEVFGVILLDTHGRFIHNEILFRGTLIHTTIHPREVVKLALKHNASKMIIYHNHPAGSLHPTKADQTMTCILSQILKVIDVLIVDHVIINEEGYFSFQEHDEMPRRIDV